MPILVNKKSDKKISQKGMAKIWPINLAALEPTLNMSIHNQ